MQEHNEKSNEPETKFAPGAGKSGDDENDLHSPDVVEIANRVILYSKLQEISGNGGYRRRLSSHNIRVAAPAAEVAAERPNAKEETDECEGNPPDDMRLRRISSRMQVHLNNVNIHDKADLIRVLELYAGMFGLYFCPLIKDDFRQSRAALPGNPLKIYDFANATYAILIEPIGADHYVIKGYRRQKSAGAGTGGAQNAESDSLWYPLSRKD